MKTLQSALHTYLHPSGIQPMGTGPRKPTAAQRERLLRDVDLILKRNQLFVWLIAAGLVILFVTSLVLSLMSGSSTAATVALTALGISAPACIWWMMRLWREKSSLELIIRLAVEYGGDAFDKLIAILAEKAGGAPPPDTTSAAVSRGP
jgi:hypothetical protein